MDNLEAAQEDDLGICDALGFSTEELIEQLKTSPDSPEAKARFDQWEAFVRTAMENLYPKDTNEYHVRLHMRIAVLYSLAGRVEDANQAWYDAWFLADSSGETALAEEIYQTAQKYGYGESDEQTT